MQVLDDAELHLKGVASVVFSTDGLIIATIGEDSPDGSYEALSPELGSGASILQARSRRWHFHRSMTSLPGSSGNIMTHNAGDMLTDAWILHGRYP